MAYVNLGKYWPFGRNFVELEKAFFKLRNFRVCSVTDDGLPCHLQQRTCAFRERHESTFTNVLLKN